MSEKNSNLSSEEVDLGYLFRKIGGFFKNLVKAIVLVFNFYFKKRFVVAGIIVISGIIGFLLEKNASKLYINTMIVQPNFASTEYLYKKIEILKTKISHKDSIFLKEVFNKEWERVVDIEIIPINDVYEFVMRDEIYQKTFQLLLEEKGSFELLEDPINIRMYKQHVIEFMVKEESGQEAISTQLLFYLNDNLFFQNQKEVSLNAYEERFNENNKSIRQIDSIVSTPSKEMIGNINAEGISFNGVQDFNELFAKKTFLLKENLLLGLQLNSEDEVIKLVDGNYGVIYKDALLQKNKALLLPFLFFTLFSLIYFFLFIRKKTILYIKD